MSAIVITRFIFIQGQKYVIMLLYNILLVKDDYLMNASQIASSSCSRNPALFLLVTYHSFIRSKNILQNHESSYCCDIPTCRI